DTGHETESFYPWVAAASSFGIGHGVQKNGTWVPGAYVSAVTGDDDYVYVELSGVSFSAGDTFMVAQVQELVIKNTTGIDTTYWSEADIQDNVIPNVTFMNVTA